MVLYEFIDKINSCKVASTKDYSAWCINIRDFETYIFDIVRYLSNEENKKSERIKLYKARELFCLRKGIIRFILGNYLSIKPEKIEYSYDTHGKPYFSHNMYKNIHFNISHSKEFLLIGVAEKGKIGVDVEKSNMNLNHSLLAGSLFSPQEMTEYKNYNKQDQIRAFLKAWVQKEAISKAAGLGISIGFNDFSVKINPRCSSEQYGLRLDNIKKYYDVSMNFKDEYYLAIALQMDELN